MAHRSTPQPDAAGKVSPVKRTSLSVIPAESAPFVRKSEASKSHAAEKHSLNYWELIFAIFILLAVLLLGWRIGKVFWGTNPAGQNKSPSLDKPDTSHIALHPSMINSTAPAQPPVMPSPRIAHSAPNHKAISSKLVIVRALVGIDGKVKEAKIVRGDGALKAAALQTVMQLNFTPYAPQGKPAEFETEITVSQRRIGKTNSEIQISVPQQSSAVQ